MALIESYSTLITAVQSYLARSDLADDAPGFVQLFEQRFYRQPKNFGPWMEQALSLTIAAGVAPVPADFLAVRAAYVSGYTGTLDRATPELIYLQWPRGICTGRPLAMARQGDSFIFGPEPDSAYTIGGAYYGKPTSLRAAAADAAAHWLILNAPDLCLYGALLEAEPYVKNDERIAVWRAYFGQAQQDYRDLIAEGEHVGYEVLA